jgi:hypothetical protein
LRLTLGRAAKPATPAGGGAAPPEAGGELLSEEPHAPRQGFFPWLTHTPGAMIGVGLTGAGLIGGGAFAFGSKSSYDAAESVADQIADNAVKTDGKADGKGSGACTNPEVWLASSTAWKSKTAAQRQDRAEQYVANCDKYTRNVKSGDTFKTLAIVSFAVAGAAAVGTIVYYVVDSKQTTSAANANKRRVMVLPVYQPGFAGGLISGTF